MKRYFLKKEFVKQKQYINTLGGNLLYNNIIITHKNRCDGIGSSFLLIIFLYSFAIYNNYIFNMNKNSDDNIIIDYSIFSNFYGLTKLVNIIDLKKHSFETISYKDFNKKNIQKTNNTIYCFDDNTKDLENCMKNITDFNNYFPLNFRQKLFNNFKLINKNYPEYFNKSMVNIAIHIRRGDICFPQNIKTFEHAYFPNKYFVLLINSFHKKYKNANIHIFSNKENTEGWDDFKDLNVTLHLRSRIANGLSKNNQKQIHYEKKDICHFCEADILVIGGTFSYVAAFFNLNTVYYPMNYWHSSLKHWIPYKCK
jgi:hypothetical protein